MCCDPLTSTLLTLLSIRVTEICIKFLRFLFRSIKTSACSILLLWATAYFAYKLQCLAYHSTQIIPSDACGCLKIKKHSWKYIPHSTINKTGSVNKALTDDGGDSAARSHIKEHVVERSGVEDFTSEHPVVQGNYHKHQLR